MTPLALDFDMSRNEDEKLSSHLIQLYPRKVGSDIYASICTRPDIALDVSMCADDLLLTFHVQQSTRTTRIG